MKYQYQIRLYPHNSKYSTTVTGLVPSLERELRKRGVKIEVIPFSGKELTITTPTSLEADGTHLLKVDMNRNLFFSRDSYITKLEL